MDYYKFILLKKFSVDIYEPTGCCIYRCVCGGGAYTGKWKAVWGQVEMKYGRRDLPNPFSEQKRIRWKDLFNEMHYLRQTEGRDLVNEVTEYIEPPRFTGVEYRAKSETMHYEY